MNGFSNRLLVASFVFTLFFALFFSYPDAILPRGFSVLPWKTHEYPPFARSLPAIEILAPLAAAVILVVRPPNGFPFFGPFLVIVFSVLLHAIFNRVSLEESFHFSGMAVIPFATLILYQKKIIRLNSLSIAFSLLWLHQIFSGFYYISIHESPIGISGNRNWMAALLMATSPWAAHRFYRMTPSRWLPFYRVIPAIPVIILPTLFILRSCDSRAAWLSLFLLPLFSCYLFIATSKRKLFFLLSTLLVASISIYTAFRILPKESLTSLTRDVRVPIWSATLNLVKEYPLGVGPGNFQKYFAPFRADSGYAENKSATDSTIHPHNEPLYLAASIGIPGMLAFIILTFPIFNRKSGECAMVFLSRCSAFTLFVHSLFDLVLVQMPCSLIALICLGIVISETKSGGRMFIPAPPPRLLWISLGAALSIFIFVRDTLFDHLVIEAYVQAASGEAEAAYKSLIESAAVKPGSIEILYQAADMLRFTNIQEKKSMAAKLHRSIFEQDPSYSHVNLYLGLQYLNAGNFTEAESHLLKEVRLFPLSAEGYSRLYALYCLTGQYDRLRSAYKKLIEILLWKKTQIVSKKDLPDLVSRWVRLTEEGDSLNSMKTARRLSNHIPADSADPALIKMTELFSWPDFEKTGVNSLDFFYWNSRIKMSAWIDTHKIKTNDFIYFLNKFKRRFEISDEEDYEPPGVAWEKKRVSPVSAIHLFTELARMAQGEVILEKRTDKEGIIYIYFKGEHHSLSFPGWKSHSLLSASPYISWQPDKTFVFLPVQSFYLRTPLFQAYLEKYLPERAFLKAAFPHITVLDAMERYSIQTAKIKPDMFLFREEFDYFTKTIAPL